MPHPVLTFTRLTRIAPEDILAHMSDPRVAQHMPLIDFEWTAPRVAEFVAAKEACWQRDGLGHWAFERDGRYIGWGGFQKEGDEWDFGLVLVPSAFGVGAYITRRALALARADARIPYVTFLLPLSRRNLGGLDRLGAAPLGIVRYGGRDFRKYRLETG